MSSPEAMCYSTSDTVSVDEFKDILRRSGLATRRPVDDMSCLEGMLRCANLLVTCRRGELLIGVARSVTDFHYCCYLSDLAVDEEYQRQGIGSELIRRTQAALGSRAQIILLSAPAAVDYYPRIGFERHRQAWILPRERSIGTRSTDHGG